MSTVLCFLIATVTLLGLISSPCSAIGPVKEDSARPRTILDNFDGDRHAGIAWHTSPGVAGSQAHLTVVSGPKQAVHGRALHLRYYFSAAARALASAGLHA